MLLYQVMSRIKIHGKKFVILIFFYVFLYFYLGLNRIQKWPESSFEPDSRLFTFGEKCDLHKILFGLPQDIKAQFKKSTVKSNNSLTEIQRQEFENLMKWRQTFIEQQCQEFKKDSFQENYDTEVYVKDENLVYCPIHKASSSTWYQNFMLLWVYKNVSSCLDYSKAEA